MATAKRSYPCLAWHHSPLAPNCHAPRIQQWVVVAAGLVAAAGCPDHPGSTWSVDRLRRPDETGAQSRWRINGWVVNDG